MASRIALYEAGASARFIEVDSKTKRTLAGDDFLVVNPLGLVPAIRTDDGEVLTENAAILQYIADCFQPGGLAPREGMARSHLHQWLSFIGTELHKVLFTPLFDAKIPEQARARALEKGDTRLARLDAHLRDREFLLDDFSVADAYLFTVLTGTSRRRLISSGGQRTRAIMSASSGARALPALSGRNTSFMRPNRHVAKGVKSLRGVPKSKADVTVGLWRSSCRTRLTRRTPP
jgi:glutathione S-transferase